MGKYIVIIATGHPINFSSSPAKANIKAVWINSKPEVFEDAQFFWKKLIIRFYVFV